MRRRGRDEGSGGQNGDAAPPSAMRALAFVLAELVNFKKVNPGESEVNHERRAGEGEEPGENLSGGPSWRRRSR